MTGSELGAVVVFGLVGVAAYQAGIAVGRRERAEEERQSRKAWEAATEAEIRAEYVEIYGVRLRVIPGGKGDAA